MQPNPVQRTVRIILFSVGFVLFVLVAFRSAAHISDPRFIKGKPFLWASSHALRPVALTPEDEHTAAVSIQLADAPQAVNENGTAKNDMVGSRAEAAEVRPAHIEKAETGQSKKADIKTAASDNKR